MHFLSVGAIFKNESDSIVEWLKHYIYHGVEHFYLIDDNSDDDTVSKIQEYIDKGYITLYQSSEPYYLGRQRNLYNQFFLPHMKQKDTQWLLMVDLDEYVWSPLSIRIDVLLRHHCGHLGQIQIRQYTYGSNGHQTQPNGLVKNFTKRCTDPIDCYKYFVNSNFEFSSLNIHYANFLVDSYKKDNSVFIVIDIGYFILNHYSCQSTEFWKNVKCTRGDGDAYRVRTMEDMKGFDTNDVEDLQLWEQNKNIQ